MFLERVRNKKTFIIIYLKYCLFRCIHDQRLEFNIYVNPQNFYKKTSDDLHHQWQPNLKCFLNNKKKINNPEWENKYAELLGHGFGDLFLGCGGVLPASFHEIRIGNCSVAVLPGFLCSLLADKKFRDGLAICSSVAGLFSLPVSTKPGAGRFSTSAYQFSISPK